MNSSSLCGVTMCFRFGCANGLLSFIFGGDERKRDNNYGAFDRYLHEHLCTHTINVTSNENIKKRSD